MNLSNKPLVIFLLTFLLMPLVEARDNRLINLRGGWKFSIGNSAEWAKPEFDDSQWDEIFVPSSWEDEGYNGYNGYAWYRKSFDYSSRLEDENLVLKLGNIDDVDEVYLNGTLIGFSGSFPPHYYSAYNIEREYSVPAHLLKKSGQNIIAIKVYDERLSGGILRGDIGFFSISDKLIPDLPLTGLWKFTPQDKMEFAEPEFNDADWDELRVPMRWDYQGYERLQGFAWYRLSFQIPEYLRGEALVLLLGRIDDFDATYFNGTLIGETGNMRRAERTNLGNVWQENRSYYIPKDLIKWGETNTIAVRVYDGYQHGGIYEGPIGVIIQRRLQKYYEKEKNNFWDLFRSIFN